MTSEKIKRKVKSATLELNEKTLAKSKEVLETMLEEVKNRAPKKPAETIVKENIELIDKLSKSGVSLPIIYERLNKAIPLGITSASFTQYIRNVRKMVGSDLYVERRKQKSKKKEDTSNNIATENNSIATIKSSFKCESCENQAEMYASPKIEGKNFWHCKECNTFYYDENGTLTNKQLTDNTLVDINK